VLFVVSASRPKVKQRVEMEIPRMVRNWRCQPKELFWGVVRWVGVVWR
jgi:hypothetical protein